jgi:hypothetical protein
MLSMPGANKKQNTAGLPAKRVNELGQILDSPGVRTYQRTVIFGQIVGAVLILVGVAVSIAGVSGSIDWIVNGVGWGSKLTNASPGVFFSLLGFLIFMRSKPKIRFSYTSTWQGAAAGKGRGKPTVTKVQVSGEMSALPDPRDEDGR